MKRQIQNKEDHKKAIQRLELLTDKGEAGNISDVEEMEIEYLSVLIEAYEEKYFAIDEPNPVEYLKYVLENKNMKQKDLVGIIGGGLIWARHY